ncbi:MAG: glucuronate isomerase [Oscillospiraceae bacterium]|jgi:glucuronate isomerase|nr:glucuronate isomerase [Oscillospiraceae bacterium]
MPLPYLHDAFLLTTAAARQMFAAAAAEPIFDWHCHLSPKEIFENETPRDITQLWLSGDHYKWRAMRGCGCAERLVTGDARGDEKFAAWAGCQPKLIGNPLLHWAGLELRRFFGVEEPLNAGSAARIFSVCNKQIAGGGFTPRELIRRSNVAALCTTDDPADSLEYHAALAKEALGFRVLPAFRPDRALAIEQPGFLPWLKSLEARCGAAIGSFAALRAALSERMEVFAALGCVASDHGFAKPPFAPADVDTLERIFAARLADEALTPLQAEQYQTALLLFLGERYAAHGWAMELHIGPMRNNNTRAFQSIGADAGYDSMDDAPVAQALSRLLDALDARGALPKTILFNLNPKDGYVLGTMLGNFQGGGIPGRLQYGPAWWFLDHIDGMREQLRTLGNLGALGTFVGMVTDSRSFLSYPRHEYFRRIFCGLCGEWVEQGLYPDDAQALEGLARDVAFRNAAAYFSRTKHEG